MYLLLTNDDGVDSPGILALYEAVAAIPEVEVAVIAPDHNWSISGHNKTMDRPLRIKEIVWLNGVTVLTTDGTPADCVSLAGLGLLPKRPDLVISGINTGPNLGDDVTYSGTVAAAMEAHIAGIPAIAISLDAFDSNWIFENAAGFAAQLVERFMRGEGPGGLPISPELFLNVNVPNLPSSEIKGVAITRQGRRIYQDVLVTGKDPRGRPYYWIGGDRPSGYMIEGTDFEAVMEHKISITPMMLDLTNYRLLQQMQDEWKF